MNQPVSSRPKEKDAAFKFNTFKSSGVFSSHIKIYRRASLVRERKKKAVGLKAKTSGGTKKVDV